VGGRAGANPLSATPPPTETGQVPPRSDASSGKHAGRHAHLAQRSPIDPAALRPRRGHLHERLRELRQPGRLVDLGELRVDVEPLLNQFDLTDRRRFLGDPLLDLRSTLLERLRAGTFGARSAVR
jgi:hypothetical protein